jgi:hypothetical protein
MEVLGYATAYRDPARLRNKEPGEKEDSDEEKEKGPYITVAIPESDIWDDGDPSAEGDPSITGTKKKASWFKRKFDAKYDAGGQKTHPVRMLKSDFVKYFLKDQKTGQYREGVVEPPGGRKQFLQQCIYEYRTGQMDEQAYELRNYAQDYEEFERKRGPVRKALGNPVVTAADFMAQPYTPWAGKPIR